MVQSTGGDGKLKLQWLNVATRNRAENDKAPEKDPVFEDPREHMFMYKPIGMENDQSEESLNIEKTTKNYQMITDEGYRYLLK